MRPALFILTLLLTGPSLVSAQNQTLEQRFIEAHAAFMQGLAGDESYTDRAQALFEELNRQAPDNPLFQVYLGGTYTIQGREAWMPWNKIDLVEKGLEIIDRALNKLRPRHDEMLIRGTPVGIEARLVALNTFLELPGFFNRLQPAKELLTDILTCETFERAPDEVRGQVYLQAATIAQREENPAGELRYLKQAKPLLRQSSHLLARVQKRLEAF